MAAAHEPPVFPGGPPEHSRTPGDAMPHSAEHTMVRERGRLQSQAFLSLSFLELPGVRPVQWIQGEGKVHVGNIIACGSILELITFVTIIAN